MNTCHSPGTGQFCSTGGGGGVVTGKERGLAILKTISGEDINIIPQADNEKFIQMIRGKDKVKSETNVPVSQLKGQQPVVSKAKVEKYISNFDESRYNESLPIVLKYKNDYVVLDGHHKLSAKKLMGESEAKVQLTEYFD